MQAILITLKPHKKDKFGKPLILEVQAFTKDKMGLLSIISCPNPTSLMSRSSGPL
jgi:hypothetical protein